MWQQIEPMFVGKWYVHVGIERAYIHLAPSEFWNVWIFDLNQQCPCLLTYYIQIDFYLRWIIDHIYQFMYVSFRGVSNFLDQNDVIPR